jgi:hypothetical protein
MRKGLLLAFGAAALIGSRAYADASVTIRIGAECDHCHETRRVREREERRWFQRPSGRWVLKVRIAWYDHGWDCWRYGPWKTEYVGRGCYHHSDHWYHHPSCHRTEPRCRYRPHPRHRHHWGVRYEYEYRGPRKRHTIEYRGGPPPKRCHPGRGRGAHKQYHRRSAPDRRPPHHIDRDEPVRRRPVRPVPGLHKAVNRVEKREAGLSRRGSSSRGPVRIETRRARDRSSNRVIRVSERKGVRR